MKLQQSLSKRALSVFMALVLVCGLLPYNAAQAYADETDGIDASTVEDTPVQDGLDAAADEAVADATAGAATETDSADVAASANGASTVATTDATADVVRDNTTALTESDDVEIVEDTSAFEFIYVDTKTAALGETQYVAIAFTDAANADTAKLWYQKDDGDLQSVDASKVADGAALYEFNFATSDDLGIYNLVKVSWGSIEDGTAGESAIDGDTELGYSFSVVETIDEDEGAEMSVYTIDEEGNLEEAGTLDEALETAEATTETADDATDAGLLSAIEGLVSPRKAYATDGSGNTVVALDPGHGGSDPGACANGLKEANLTLKIANYCKQYLDSQKGITTFMTRTNNTYVGLKERVTKAVNAGADVFVSFHINSTSGATGFEVWVQNDSSWRYELHTKSEYLGTKILNKLSKLGLKNKGNKQRDSETGNTYADGSVADYLSVLYNSRLNNLPAVLIEHGFINGQASDVNLLKSESGLRNMGIADAQGIMEYLAAYPTEDYSLVYDYDYYIEHNADVKAAFNGDKQKTLQHFVTYGMKEGRQGNTLFNVDYYRSHNSDLVSAYGSDLKKYYEHFIKCGTNEGRPASEEFDLTSYYNANGDLRGAFGTNLKKYYTHYVQYGKSEGRTCTGVAELQSCRTSQDGTDYSAVYDGAYYAAQNPDVKAYATWSAGSVSLVDDGKLLRHFVSCGMKEGRPSSASFDLDSYYNANQDLRIAYGTNLKSYYTHYMKYGKNEGRTCTGVGSLQNYRTSLDGTDYSAVYDGAYYRAGYSDLDAAFTKDAYGHKLFDDTALLRHFLNHGASEGRVSSESFDLVSYFNANGDLRAAYGFNYKNYYTHYVKYGKNEGRTCTGVAELNAYTTVYNGKDYSGEYDGQYYYSNNEDLRKAFSKELDNATLINDYALIRHYVTYGVKEGRLGSSSAAETLIMGNSKTTAAQMASYYKKMVGASTYPASTYSSKGAASIDEFAMIVYTEAKAEGVRAEVVFCQAMKETGWLRFGGSVKAEQCNFAGIGATGGGTGGATFADVRTGIRAQVQHLKAYASTDALNNACVDPRFNLVKRGSAPKLEDLNGKWAVPGNGYGESIYSMIKALLKC